MYSLFEQIAKIADYDKRVDECVTEISALIPQLFFALSRFDSLVQEAYDGTRNGRSFPEIFSGLDHEFATKVRAAIHAAAPVDWYFNLPWEAPQKPTPKGRSAGFRVAGAQMWNTVSDGHITIKYIGATSP